MQSFGCDAAGLSHVSQGIYSSTARALDLLYYGGDGGQARIRAKRLFRVGVRRGLDGCKHKTGLKEVALRASGQGRGEPEHEGEPGFCVDSHDAV